VGKRWTWVAWSMLAVFAVSLVVGTILAVANGTFQQDAVNQVLLLLGFSAFMVVGALIVAQRPGNAIGWIFSTIALLAVTGQLASQYAIYPYVTRPGSLPAATLAAWYGLWPWFPITALTLIFTPCCSRPVGLKLDLKRYLRYYNTERSHTGRWTNGRTPEAVLGKAKLWHKNR
jgi:hypothetical protein